MNFITNKYQIIRKAIDPDFADVVFDYLQLKRKSQQTMIRKGYIKKDDMLHGHYNDHVCVNTWSIYGDTLCEIILYRLIDTMSQIAGKEVVPNYSYSRLYKKGDTLPKHKDRISCKLSATLFLGGDPWSFFLKDKKKIKVDLEQGDLLVYQGTQIQHWREKFKGYICGQLFLHYGYAEDPEDIKNIFDKREHLGLPTTKYGT